MTGLLESLGVPLPKPPRQASFETLMEMDEKLARVGFQPMTPWWKKQAKRFYETNARLWAARVGRGGVKSTTMAKLAANETLNSDWQIPPGEIHYMSVVSENKDEAQNRLRLLEGYLRALCVRYRRAGPTIDLQDRPLGFKVFAARIGAVSGFRAIGRCGDEVAKWSDDGADPSEEVWASLAAMTVTHPRAIGLLFSSPMGMTGLHYAEVEKGDVPGESIATSAPTWVANPSITEAQALKLARGSERIFRREYGAIPQGSLTSVFDGSIVTRAFENGKLSIQSEGDEILIVDASRGGDDWAYARARRVWAKGKHRVHVFEIGAVPNAADSEAAVKWLAERTPCRVVIADQYEAGALKALFGQQGFSFFEFTWGNASKKVAVDKVERWMRDGELMLCASEKLRTQLLEYQERITKSGELAYGGSGRNDDYAAVILTLALGDEGGRLPSADEPAALEPAQGTDEYYEALEKRLEDRQAEKLRQELARARDENW